MAVHPSVAFLGLGAMGAGMASRLLDAGSPLTVYNRSPERAEAFRHKGARIATTPKEAAAGARIIIAMVADDAASRALWLGPTGALAGAGTDTLLIECSTLSVSWIRELGTLAARQNLELLDAPVTGSKPQAAAGELVFLVGGASEALELARPLLSVMGRDVIHLGPLGSGALMKLINNFVCGTQLAAIAEAIAMIERGQLDNAKAISVLASGAPGSPMVKTLTARMASRDYTPNFALRLMAKDLSYAIAEAHRGSLDLSTAKCALEKLNQAIAAGYGDRDISSVVELARNERG
jgi:3-hydroxyisobutyrate dehydrogenase